MSRSPDERREDGEEADAYLRGWRAINTLMRRGHSWSGHERNVAHLNLGDGTFVDVSHVAGLDQELDGRALATLDFDRDGDTDLLLTGRQGPRVWLFENTAADPKDRGRGRVGFFLRGTASNREAVGARLELRCRGEEGVLTRSVHAGQGFLAQSSRWIRIAAPASEIESVEVVWPGGEREAFSVPDADGRWVLEEGRGVPRPHAPRGTPPELRAAPEETTRSGPVVLAAPVPMPSLELRTPDAGGAEGSVLRIFGLKPGGKGTGTGRPVVLNLWSADCAPCLRELRAFAAEADRLRDENVAFLALCVDEDVERARTALDGVGWPFAWALAPPEALDRLDAIHAALFNTEERLALPTSFLVDPSGMIRAIQRGPMEPEELLRSLDLAYLSPAQQLQRALPVPDRGWWVQLPDLGPGFLRGAFARRGLLDAETEASRMDLVVESRSPAEILQSFGRDHAARGDFEAAVSAMRQALDKDPDFVPARFDLGLLLQRMGRPHDAIGAYLGVLERAPGHSQARFNLALAYLETRQFKSARRELSELEERGSPLAAELEGVIESVERAEAQEGGTGGD